MPKVFVFNAPSKTLAKTPRNVPEYPGASNNHPLKTINLNPSEEKRNGNPKTRLKPLKQIEQKNHHKKTWNPCNV